MTVAGTSAPERAPASRVSLVWRAAAGGFLAWLPLAVGGQIVAWTGYLITRSFRPWSWLKVGLANTVAAARVPFEARAEAPDAVAAGGPVSGMTSMRVTLALGAGTLVMLVLLFRAGHAAARRSSLRPGAAVAASLATAVGFAVPMLASALLVTLRFPSIGIGVLRPVVWAAFAVPFVTAWFAAGVGTIAAARSTPSARLGRRRLVAAARGAWHALVWGVVLAFLGTLVFATVHPRVTSSYGRWLEREGAGGAMLAMYHGLLLPNQSVDVLASSMGSCTAFSFGGGSSRVCLGGIDVGDPLTGLLVGEPTRDASRAVTFGPVSLAFLFVPALASIAGGRRAAAGARHVGERVLRAACAGVGFGVLAGVSAWAAAITIVGADGPIASLGADPIETALLGAVWGAGGGVVGAFVRDRRATPEEPPRRRPQDAEGSPSETSAK